MTNAEIRKKPEARNSNPHLGSRFFNFAERCMLGTYPSGRFAVRLRADRGRSLVRSAWLSRGGLDIPGAWPGDPLRTGTVRGPVQDGPRTVPRPQRVARPRWSGHSRRVRFGDPLRTGTVRGPAEDRPPSAVCGPLERRGKITRALAIAWPLLARRPAIPNP